jgi:phosphopantothenoylcysteine decarboxylase/phosphopantothenate--cysteine ligase
MASAVLDRCATADLVVMAAAVADFRPKAPVGVKLPKSDGVPDLVLEPTTDILAAVAARRRPGQTLIGFAAEDGPAQPGALDKLQRKGVDLVVGNDVSAPGRGFGHDTNAVTIVSAGGMELDVGPTDKRAVARAVLDAAIAHRRAQ